MVIPSLGKFLAIHQRNSGDLQRLGQRFVNFYHCGNWPELFYMVDDGKAIPMIEQWLIDNQYIDELPKKREI